MKARVLVRRRISLKRLIEGGAAMLAALRRNHHSARWGASRASPFVIYRLRVLVDS